MMIIIVILVLILLVSNIASNDDINVLLSIAYKEANAGNIRSAAKTFNKAAVIATSKGDVNMASQLYFNCAHAYSQLMDHNNAIEAYKKCLQISNNAFRPCHIKIASAYRDIEDFISVQKHLLQAIEMEPSNPDAYNYMAQILNNLKQFNKSITYYEAAIALSPKDPNLYAHIGDTYSNAKQILKAMSAFKKGIELSPQFSLPYTNWFTSLDNALTLTRSRNGLFVSIGLPKLPLMHLKIG